jgi:hypothetical protein
MKQFARVLLFVSSCLVAIAGLPVDEQSQPDYDIDTGMNTT